MRLSDRAQRLQPSATIAAAQRARQLKSRGTHVYDFSLGEPDFPTPRHICDAAVEAMRRGMTHYTPSSGIPELREAIAERYRTRGLPCSAQQVIVSNGAKHALHNVLTVLCQEGDDVLIPAPYWVSYSALVELTGARPVVIDTREEDRFKLRPEALRGALTPRTRVLLLNSPCNPTGSVYSAEELLELARVLEPTEVVVVSDEIYEDLVYDGLPVRPFAALAPSLSARTVTVSGVSKSYAMTGWRIGWSVAPREVAEAIDSLQSQQTSNPCSISQYAALAALKGSQECVEQMRAEFERRRALVQDWLSVIPGVRAVRPEGAFYFFVNVQQHLGRRLAGIQVTDSISFATACLEGPHVALVPGTAFGRDGYVRLSFAASMEELDSGLRALAAFLR
jgi:aspartate aminotransferase